MAAEQKANDLFRRIMKRGSLTLSAGILSLSGETQICILDAVRDLEDFDCSDTLDDHSLGDAELNIIPPGAEPCTLIVFFKLIRHGPDRQAALTLSLADEWWACLDVIGPLLGRQHDE